MARVAVIGLGAMGGGMARSCLAAGLETLGVDTDAARVAAFQADGGAQGAPPQAAADLDIVVVVVVNAAQAEAALFGPSGVAPALRKGAVIVCCVTMAPEQARALSARAEALGLFFLDAPISGGAAKAARGALSILASGPEAGFAAAKPALDAMAETVFRLGEDPGAGSAMKAINQMLVGVHIAAAAEALTFGMTQGVAPEKTLEVISKCAGASWALENRGPHIAAGDYTPLSAVDIWPKDLGIVLDIARGAKFSAPMTAAALQQFVAASGSGLGREDDAAIAKVYARNAGLTLPGDR
ncbi:L-threonate dehydrogenase [Pikeienuella sp. HZG-20]|uniref:L-threonate dehydrogenase n=1 Tax=Paludibacillus litoralis TaxID=3133267 RepID=UPI0030EDFF90